MRAIQPGSSGARLALDAPDLARPIPSGASLCVSGVCLTVTTCDETRITFDVVPETLSRSTLGALSVGDRVNLELALRVGDRLDGHTVQGHVDGTARVVEVRRGRGDRVCRFEADETLVPYLIPKGSVAVDGVSLTLAGVAGARFSVALIPTTLERTTLGDLRVGRRVNVETDILARTIVETMRRWQAAGASPPLTVERLRENGW